MKKLLASALLTGLLLGVASPVLAVEGVGGTAATGETTIITEFSASYTVTIPSDLSIGLVGNDFDNITDSVTLDNRTAAGHIAVEATVNDLILEGVDELAAKSNQTLTTALTGDTVIDDLTGKSIEFDLEEIGSSQNVTVGTIESSTENLAGVYNGTIDFTFNYVAAPAGE